MHSVPASRGPRTPAEYLALGWQPIPIPRGQKAPNERGWPTKRYAAVDFPEVINIGLNLAVSGIVDVDLDVPVAIRLAPRFLPPTPAVFGRPGAPASHWLYRSPGAGDFSFKPRRGAELAKLVTRIDPSSGREKQTEICSIRCAPSKQTVAPGSIHPTGEPIEWCSWGDPAEVDPAQLRDAVARLATAVALTFLGFEDERACTVAKHGGDVPAELEPYMAQWFGVSPSSSNLSPLPTMPGELPDVIEQGARWATLQSYAAALRKRDSLDERQICERLQAVDAERCSPPLQTTDPGKLKYIAKVACQLEPGTVGLAAATNDSGNATLLARQCGDDYQFARGLGWLRWDGARWTPDDGPWTEMEGIAQRMIADGAAMGGPAGDELRRWGRQSGNYTRVRDAIELFSHRDRRDLNDYDANPWLLCTPSGTVDLRTGELRPNSRDDLITKCTNVQYDPNATCPTFVAFLGQCMDGDAECVAYLRRFLGSTLTGCVDEHAMGLWHGAQGRNGKGTLLNLLLHVLGDYAGVVPAEALLHSRGSTHPTALMVFRGRRLVISNEAPEDRPWDEARVKTLTGGDPITAHYMRKDFVTFDPTHKLVLACNERPIVRAGGDAFWSRLHLLPWRVSFRGREDRALSQKLKAEAVGVLAWLVAGAREWLQAGKRSRLAAVMLSARADYQDFEDVLTRYVSECTRRNPTAQTKTSALYSSYRFWCESNGETLLSARKLYSRLEEHHGFEREHKRDGDYFLGVMLVGAISVAVP